MRRCTEKCDPKIATQYLVDKKGKKTGVVLDIRVFENLLEELEDMYDVVSAEKILARKGKTYSLEDVEKAFGEKYYKNVRGKKAN